MSWTFFFLIMNASQHYNHLRLDFKVLGKGLPSLIILLKLHLLTFSLLGKKCSRQHFEIVIFPRKHGLTFLAKLSPICMKCQTLFSGEK